MHCDVCGRNFAMPQVTCDHCGHSVAGDLHDRWHEEGRRSALRGMLRQVLGDLGYDDSDAKRAAWIIEREETVSTLRTVCEEFGDNDWSNDLHLGDVIDKHLVRHLNEMD